MCPACVASAGLMAAAGATSSGGVAMLAFKRLFRKQPNNRNERKMKLAEQPTEVVSAAEWLVARTDLLNREKEFSRQRDALSAARRKLPMVKVEKEYVFEGPDGKERLPDLFNGRSQLIIYHFMLGPGWDEGCKSCSYLADHFDGANWHLPHRDTALVVVSRAPLSENQDYKQRMDWRLEWVSSYGSDFNFDYHVSFTEEEEKKNKVYYEYEATGVMSEELPGLSVFYKEKDGNG